MLQFSAKYIWHVGPRVSMHICNRRTSLEIMVLWTSWSHSLEILHISSTVLWLQAHGREAQLCSRVQYRRCIPCVFHIEVLKAPASLGRTGKDLCLKLWRTAAILCKQYWSRWISGRIWDKVTSCADVVNLGNCSAFPHFSWIVQHISTGLQWVPHLLWISWLALVSF